MSYTLVVVDMQTYFSAANDKSVLQNCKNEVAKAMDKGAAIIFVEFIGCGRTIPGLVKLTKYYDRVFIVRKDDDDGSREVRKVIKDNKLPANKIKVCGVNTDCCVLETVLGLNTLMKPSKMKVLAYACNSEYDHTYGLHLLQKFIGRKK